MYSSLLVLYSELELAGFVVNEVFLCCAKEIYILYKVVGLFVCLFVRGVHFDTQNSRDYINCSTGTRSEASEGPTSILLK